VLVNQAQMSVVSRSDLSGARQEHQAKAPEDIKVPRKLMRGREDIGDGRAPMRERGSHLEKEMKGRAMEDICAWAGAPSKPRRSWWRPRATGERL
jgi:hypothetical protein